MSKTYRHSEKVREARDHLLAARKNLKTLTWMSGGYEGMGGREIEKARDSLAEATMWLDAAVRSLDAGAERAIKRGFPDGDAS